MPDALTLGFSSLATPPKGVLVVFCDDGLKFGSASRKALAPAGDLVARAAKAERFTGKNGSALELIVPEGLKLPRLIVIGIGKPDELKPKDFLKFGGAVMGKLPASATEATVLAELPGGAMSAARAADFAQGMRLRAYAFDRYKTKRKDEDRRANVRSPSRSATWRRRSRPLTHVRQWPTASTWRAISSTSRPMCSIRWNSPAVPARS